MRSIVSWRTRFAVKLRKEGQLLTDAGSVKRLSARIELSIPNWSHVLKTPINFRPSRKTKTNFSSKVSALGMRIKGETETHYPLNLIIALQS